MQTLMSFCISSNFLGSDSREQSASDSTFMFLVCNVALLLLNNYVEILLFCY